MIDFFLLLSALFKMFYFYLNLSDPEYSQCVPGSDSSNQNKQQTITPAPTVCFILNIHIYIYKNVLRTEIMIFIINNYCF